MSTRVLIIEEARRWGLSPAELPQYVGEIGKRIRLSLVCVEVTAVKPSVKHGFRVITFADGDVNLLHSSEYARKECAYEVGKKYEVFATPKRHHLHDGQKMTRNLWHGYCNTEQEAKDAIEEWRKDHLEMPIFKSLHVPEPVPFLESQLHELCIALGWQGGTYDQVLQEIKRLKALADDQRVESHC